MRNTGDYPGVSLAHLAVAKNYSSPFILGPPVCDELVALIQHMFSEDEADIVRHLKPYRPRTAASLASATARPLHEVKPILDRLASDLHVIFYFGKEGKERYTILPLVPGTFEMTMMRTSTHTLTPWHTRFAQLFEALFETGFSVEYLKKPVNPVRYLPVGEAVQAQPQAYPSDRLEAILDRYDHFAVGLCQCRLIKDLNDEGCGKMLETCTVVGDWAPHMVKRGLMRQTTKQEVLEIKAAAEKDGLVTWMVNEESGKHTSALCSCCGCCCAALRTISEFNTPGFIAKPHFMPRIDHQSCTHCEKCVEICPMKALWLVEEGDSKRLVYDEARCIGCGLCTIACDSGAMTLHEVPDYRKPPGNWGVYLTKYIPGYLSNLLNILSSRRRS